MSGSERCHSLYVFLHFKVFKIEKNQMIIKIICVSNFIDGLFKFVLKSSKLVMKKPLHILWNRNKSVPGTIVQNIWNVTMHLKDPNFFDESCSWCVTKFMPCTKLNIFFLFLHMTTLSCLQETQFCLKINSILHYQFIKIYKAEFFFLSIYLMDF